ncbi:MAG: hypothetical protein ACFB5Z_16665 [Elainellaceae cyanobacterium]
MYSSTVLTTLGKQIAERWVANLFAPAFVFWLGGVVAYLQDNGWGSLEEWLTGLDETLQVGVLVAALLLVAASGFVVQRFDLMVLRFFEGYWPRWMAPLHTFLIKRQRAWFDRADSRWNELMMQQAEAPASMTAQEIEEQIDLDTRLRQVPPQRSRQMPLRLGNILRAAEMQPQNKYGLDAIVCWPRLWMVLPDEVKDALQQARSDLNTAARVWLWGTLFLAWFFVWRWTWWVIPVGLGTAWFAHRWMLLAASTYGELLESAFDLHRFKLYEALHWPLPKTPEEEQSSGKLLTQYLWRGSRSKSPEFVFGDGD